MNGGGRLIGGSMSASAPSKSTVGSMGEAGLLSSHGEDGKCWATDSDSESDVEDLGDADAMPRINLPLPESTAYPSESNP